jgi:hypothetical protein
MFVPKRPPRRARLSAMMVEKAALEAASYLVWDERQPNLALRVRPSGSRTTFMCGWVAVELGRGFAPYWGVTHDQSLRQSQVCSPGRARQGDELRPFESPNLTVHCDKLLSFAEFPVAPAIRFRRR